VRVYERGNNCDAIKEQNTVLKSLGGGHIKSNFPVNSKITCSKRVCAIRCYHWSFLRELVYS